MKIRIVTDSASDILQPYRQDVTIMPLTVTFGEQSYREGVDLSHREFYEKLVECDSLPVTSQANPGQFADVFRAAVEAGETVVAITLSAKLSGTWQSAVIAAEEFPGKVFVVDSENAAMGQAVLVERAVELKEAGLDAPALAAQLEQEKKDIRLVALLDTLEYLKRGGRIAPTVALVGGMLSIKPVICITEGEVQLLGKARGSRNGNNLLMRQIEASGGIDFQRPFRLAYSGLSDALLQKYIDDSRCLWEGHTQSLPVSTIGGVIGTHVGPGAIGVAYFRKSAQ